MQLAKLVTLAALAALALPGSAQTVSQGTPRMDQDTAKDRPQIEQDKQSKKTQRARQDKQNSK
jgi:hypothetical protein